MRHLAALLAGSLCGLATSTSAAWGADVQDAMVPNRLFTCAIGHVVNFDARLRQAPSDLRIDRQHKLVFALPAGPRRTKPAPDVGDAPEPVPAAARIIEDPDHIAPQLRARFDQVVDFWPERVETMGMIDRQMRNAMVIDAIDPRGGSANLFMLRASELTHFDAQHIYQGRCTITTPARLPAAPAPAKASAR